MKVVGASAIISYADVPGRVKQKFDKSQFLSPRRGGAALLCPRFFAISRPPWLRFT